MFCSVWGWSSTILQKYSLTIKTEPIFTLKNVRWMAYKFNNK